MKKKILAILMATSLILTMGACSKSDETKNTRKTKTTKTEQTEEVEAEDLFLNCFWKQSSRGKGVSFRFYEDGAGYFASWENEDDEDNMGYKASTFEYKLKKDKLTITCEDNDELAGKYDISFDDRGNLILENDDVTYNLRKQEFDIEEEDFDMSQLFGYKWEYISGGEVLERFEFFEDGTGTFTSGGGDKENAYFTDITWTIKGNLLSVTRRGDWTDEYVISLENRDALKLTDTSDGRSTYYIRNTLPAETTEEPTTTTEEPSTTTTEAPTTTTTEAPTTTTTDTTTPTGRDPSSTTTEDIFNYDGSNLSNLTAIQAINTLKSQGYMFVDYQLMMDDPDVTDSAFPVGTKGTVFMKEDGECLYAYLEYPDDYVWDAQGIANFKKSLSEDDDSISFVDNGNYIIVNGTDDFAPVYGILDTTTGYFFMGELYNQDFNEYATLAEIFGFEVD